VLKEIKDAENSASAKPKRKYEEFISQLVEGIQSTMKIDEQVENLYTDFIAGSTTWKENFMQIISSEISCDSLSFLPKSLSLSGSNLLTYEKFWIMWIEYHRNVLSPSPPFTMDILITLFNESFNYINSESLIKSYFLKTMREQDQSVLKDYLVYKGKILDLDSVRSLTLTNQILFGLLDSYAQFLLRSQSKSQSEDKKFKKSNSKNNVESSGVMYEYALNCEMTINPNILKGGFRFTNTEISLNENLFFCNNKEKETNTNTEIGIGQSPNFHFKTPQNQNSKRESMNQVQNASQHHKNSQLISAGGSNLKEEENDEVIVIDSLVGLSNNHLITQNMVVSQNTIDKQLEFNNKLHNANHIEGFNCTQEIMQENLDLTQTVREESVVVLPLENAENAENVEEVVENIITMNSEEKNEILQIQENDAQQQIINYEEEKLDVIQELEAEKISDEKDEKEENLNILNLEAQSPEISENHYNRMSFTQSSQKSRTHSRSLSRGRRLNSYVTEEYPTDIVEGSIRTFNKNFNGEESAKSKSEMSTRKGEN
jgi:hypothetical protein